MQTRNWLIPLYILLLACCYLPAHSAVTATREGDLITVQNSTLKFTINLAKGASISDYLYTPFKRGITDLGWGGLLYDHVWEQTWPGEFMNRKYEGEIVNAGPAEAVIHVWTEGKGDSVKGVRLERTLRLRDNDRTLRCTVTMTNTADTGRVTGYWNQSVFWFNGVKEGMHWHQPTARGVSHDGWFVDDFTAGWLGTTSTSVSPAGLMFVMDYNDLFRLYPNAYSVTTEWMYDKIAIPPGKTWTTSFFVIPVKGMPAFSYGSRYLVANANVTQVPGALQIEHQLTRGETALQNVTVKTRIWGLRQGWKATVPDAKFNDLTEDVQSVTVRATGVESMPAGIEMTVTGTAPDGTPITESYRDYFGGDYGPNVEMRDLKPLLTLARPTKQKHYLKPDVIKYTPNATPRVLFFRGLWSRMAGADAAITAAFPTATVVDSWLDQSPVGQLYSYFPADYPELMRYDLIILGNAPIKPMDLIGQEMLKDYLAAGGNLLVLGGDQSYGNGHFTNPDLIAQFPVELGEKYNWRKFANGSLKAAESPVTQGVAFVPKDMVYYHHLCTPKKTATVAVTAADQPILVLGNTTGGGRVACVLAAPFGEAAAGETAYWDAEGWKTLMKNTVSWLIKH